MEHVEYSFSPNLLGSDVTEDFKKLISWLSEQKNIELTKVSEDLYQISYTDRPHMAHVSFNKAENLIGLVESRADSYTITFFKGFATDFNYRIYNHDFGGTVPTNTNIRDLTTLTLKPEFATIFGNYAFTPLFVSELNGGAFFARPKDSEEIHIVNPYLVNYYLAWKTTDKSKEFSYVVSPNLERFTLYAERGLIPDNFYSYYGKDLKILNYSGIDISNPGRKVFVKPFIFEISDPQFNIYMRQSEKGSLIAMDKILEGENLDGTLKRVLKSLGISDDYIRARVRPELEFDKDRDGHITPRLIVDVYVEKINKIPRGSDYSWEG